LVAALQHLNSTLIKALPDQLNALGIAGGRGGLSELFMTHSRIEDHINALRQFR